MSIFWNRNVYFHLTIIHGNKIFRLLWLVSARIVCVCRSHSRAIFLHFFPIRVARWFFRLYYKARFATSTTMWKKNKWQKTTITKKNPLLLKSPKVSSNDIGYFICRLCVFFFVAAVVIFFYRVVVHFARSHLFCIEADFIQTHTNTNNAIKKFVRACLCRPTLTELFVRNSFENQMFANGKNFYLCQFENNSSNTKWMLSFFCSPAPPIRKFL